MGIMDIQFIGSEIKGSFAAEYASSNDLAFSCLPATAPELLIDGVIREAAKNVIVNVEQLYLNQDELIKIISSVKVSVPGRIIIYAPGYNLAMDVIQGLMNIGINNYIFAVSLGEAKEELDKCITGYYDEHPLSVLSSQAETTSISERSATASVSVAVSGSMPRIGTTTIALQAVKYLLKNGKTACYIEMNDSGYLKLLEEVFEDNLEAKDDRIGMVRYQNVDMYYRREKIPEILKRHYDFYIYDYGVALVNNFALVSFLEKDKVILVCGTQPNELIEMQKVLNTFYEHPEPFYSFNLSHRNEHEDVLELMDDRASKTVFSGYTPDAFTLEPDNNTMFSQVFSLEASAPTTNEPKNKKKGLFGRKKG